MSQTLSSVSTDSSCLSSLSQFTLIENLRNKNIDLQYFVKDFDEHFKQDAVKEIIVTLFHSAGITSFTYEAYEHLEDEELSRLASLKDSLGDQPDILEKDFQKNLSSFLDGYFAISKQLFLLNDTGRLMNKITLEFMNGKWDSFRMMAATLGVKIISTIILDLETRARTSEVYDQLGQLWISLHKSVVGQGMRDCCSDVVQIILDEFSLLASYNLAILRKPDIFKWICFGLDLKNPQNRKTSYNILHQIFTQTSDRALLLRMFQKVRTRLVKILHQESNIEKITSMKILSSLAEKDIDLDLTDEEKHYIHFAIFNPSRQVGELVAKFLTHTILKNISSQSPELMSLKMLEGIITFAEESPIKDFPLLADSFSFIFTQRTFWDEWIQLFGSTNTSTAFELFYAVVERLITNQVPKNANTGYNSISKKSSETFSDWFSQNFKSWWFEAIKFMNIRMKKLSMLKIMDIVRFLKKEADPELWFEIGSELLKIFVEFTDNAMIQKSFEMVKYVCDMLESSPQVEDLFLIKLSQVVQVVVGYFKEFLNFRTSLYDAHGEVMSSQIVAVSRYIVVSRNDEFWTLAVQEIEKNRVNYQRNPELILLFVHILFGRFFRVQSEIYSLIKKEKASDDPDRKEAISMDIDALKIDAGIKSDLLEKYFSPLLEEHIPIKIRGVVCQYFIKMIILSGSHMYYHNDFSASYSNFNKCSLQKLEKTVSAAMAFKCKGNDDCCHIVGLLCKMIHEGIIPVEHLKPLLEHSGHNDFHHVKMVDAMKKFLKKFGMNKCAQLAKIILSVISNAIETKLDPKSFCEKLIDILFVQYKININILVFIHKVSLISKNRVVTGFLVESINLLKPADKSELCTMLKNAFKDFNLPEDAADYVDVLKSISEPFQSETPDNSLTE